MPELKSSKGHLDWPAIHGLLFFLIFAAVTLVPTFRVWPLLWLVPLVAYALLVVAVPALRATFRFWQFGRVTTAGCLATLMLGGGAVVVLVMFDRWAKPDVGGYAGFLPVAQLGGVVMAGVIFSLLNALLEEVVFRGILFDAVEAQWGAWVAAITTALLFGYSHLQGYPPGPTGAILAGIFGLGLGGLRVFTGGLGLPVLAHVAADAAIYTLVARTGVFATASP